MSIQLKQKCIILISADETFGRGVSISPQQRLDNKTATVLQSNMHEFHGIFPIPADFQAVFTKGLQIMLQKKK